MKPKHWVAIIVAALGAVSLVVVAWLANRKDEAPKTPAASGTSPVSTTTNNPIMASGSSRVNANTAVGKGSQAGTGNIQGHDNQQGTTEGETPPTHTDPSSPNIVTTPNVVTTRDFRFQLKEAHIVDGQVIISVIVTNLRKEPFRFWLIKTQTGGIANRSFPSTINGTPFITSIYDASNNSSDASSASLATQGENSDNPNGQIIFTVRPDTQPELRLVFDKGKISASKVNLDIAIGEGTGFRFVHFKNISLSSD